MTATVRLAYGETGLDLTIDPAVTTVVTPVHHPVTEPAEVLLRRALREPVAGPPLRERVRPGQTVAISACDGTRPQPRELMIPAILAELDGIVRLEDVVILVATGAQKAQAVRDLAEGPVAAICAASVLQLHPHATILLDEAAASSLRLADYYRHSYDHKPAWQGL